MMKLAQTVVMAALAMKGARLEELTAERLEELAQELIDEYDSNEARSRDVVKDYEFCEEIWEYEYDSPEDCVDKVDTDGDGIISVEEYAAYLTARGE